MEIGEIERQLQTAQIRLVRARGDSDLNPGMPSLREKLIRAAVLVPLVDRAEGTTVLLTQRTAHLPEHAGQIAFPGGRQDPEDRDVVSTALRETEEEVGIPRDQVRTLGRLAQYNTRTGYSVTPVVGVVTPPITPQPEPGEVDRVFEVPLAFLLDRANHQKHSRTVAGVERQFYAMPYEGHYIWGATAGMIVNLVDILEYTNTPPLQQRTDHP